ncbi:MAG: glycosyltransferase, partial [Acidimicrobiia bacterium]|nr:glycosyltransferase [Acidimicrobiia bacterium]
MQADLRDELAALLSEYGAPEGLDPAVVEAVTDLAGRIRFIDDATPEAEDSPVQHDIVIVWPSDDSTDSRWAAVHGSHEADGTLYVLDEPLTKETATKLAHLAYRIEGDQRRVEQERLGSMIDDLPTRRRCLLLGADPSNRDALELDTGGMIRIAASDVVPDHDLMTAFEPHVIAIADATEHLGASADAAAFRSMLRKWLATHSQTWIAVPLVFRSLLASMMPEHADRIVGIPVEADRDVPTLDLLVRYGVAASADALTLLMLPIAATLTDEIAMVGFAEPATPSGDEQKSPSVAYLERFLLACEAAGITTESLSRSSLAPLARRFNVSSHRQVSWQPDDLPPGAPSRTLVVIEPDWEDDFGHYGPWYHAIARRCEERSLAPLALASRALVPEAPDALPTFSYPSINRMAAPLYAPQFETELNSAVGRLLEGNANGIDAFFYTADLWHLPPVVRSTIASEGRLRSTVNLMRAHGSILDIAADAAAARSDVRALAGLLDVSADAGVRVTVDTIELADIIDDLCGVRPEVLPMAAAHEVMPMRRSAEPLVVYCPSLSQEAKGVVEFVDAAASVAGPLTGRATFRMRNVQQPAGNRSQVNHAIDRARTAGVEVIDGPMTDRRFTEVMGEADIVVVPYRSTAFRTRTSAAVVDAVRAGKPVVVTAGTWGESVVNEVGAGIAFRSGDAEDLARAITEAVNRYESLATRAHERAAGARERFSMAKLVDYLAARDPSPIAVASPEHLLERVTDLEAVLSSQIEGRRAGMRALRGEVRHGNEIIAREQTRAHVLQQRMSEIARSVERRDIERVRLEEEHRAEVSALEEEHRAEVSALEEEHRAEVSALE